MIEAFLVYGDVVVVPAFDVKAYVWRDDVTGRELSGDEVGDFGYDPGLRDQPDQLPNVRRYEVRPWLNEDDLRWYDRQRLIPDKEAEELGIHVDLTKEELA